MKTTIEINDEEIDVTIEYHIERAIKETPDSPHEPAMVIMESVCRDRDGVDILGDLDEILAINLEEQCMTSYMEEHDES